VASRVAGTYQKHAPAASSWLQGLQVFGRVQAIKLIRCSNFYPKAQIHKWLSKKCRSSSKKAEPFDRSITFYWPAYIVVQKRHSPGLPVMAGRDFKNSDSPRPKNLSLNRDIERRYLDP
jgi:hypothetical protein